MGTSHRITYHMMILTAVNNESIRALKTLVMQNRMAFQGKTQNVIKRESCQHKVLQTIQEEKNFPRIWD